MKYIRIFQCLSLISAMLLCNGCKKFLDIAPPTSSVNPTTIKDFQEMLNSDSLAMCQYLTVDAMSDDIRLTDVHASLSSNYYRRSYFYEPVVWNPADKDPVYNSSYSRILQMNIILSRVNDAPDDASNTPSNKSNVISQALIQRAFFYFQLVNTYGKAYSSASASGDLAVPLSLLPDAYALPARATVEQVYNQIIGDLKSAINNPYLPSKGADIIHPGKTAAFGLLSRVYLYKGDYNNAKICADSTLAKSSTILDYTSVSYSAPGQLLDLVANPEIIMGKVTVDAGFLAYMTTAFRISTELKTLLTTADTRFSKRWSGDAYRISSSGSNALVFDNSIAVPEIMLTKAECLAREGAFAEAGNIINQIRIKRLPAYALGTRNYTADNILGYVLDERRRELFCHGGLRLFDLKRLNQTDRKKNIVRTNDTGNLVLLTVSPESPNYILPFSPNVISANPNIVQNPRL